MIILKKPDDIHKYLKTTSDQGALSGFVPTMGALHKGHISLIETARQNSAIVIASIFINPTQFNDPKDFELYPRTIENDIYMLEKAGCDLLFIPNVEDLYPAGTQVVEHYDLGYLETVLDGKYRPGHFQGVCQVVSRLINVVKPDMLYLGQKDYQQCMVIKRLLILMGAKTEIVICPTLREANGLAMSSRNMRLSQVEKENATGIHTALIYIKEHIVYTALKNIKDKVGEILAKHNLVLDYIEIADAETLELLEELQNQKQVVALIAAYMGEVRLIDNMVITT